MCSLIFCYLISKNSLYFIDTTHHSDIIMVLITSRFYGVEVYYLCNLVGVLTPFVILKIHSILGFKLTVVHLLD